jgi:glutamate dehydrogenase
MSEPPRAGGASVGAALAAEPAFDAGSFDGQVRRRFAGAEAERMVAFARGLFAREGERYAAELPEEDRVALVASALRFFSVATSPVRCRLRTPTLAIDGWDSPYTIFESHLSDRPFIVDTIRECLHERGIAVRHLLHPVYSVERDDCGALVRMRSLEGRQESFVHCAMDRIADADLPALERELADRLGDVYMATEAYRRMRDRLERTRDELGPADLPPAEADEIDQFLVWLGDDNFVFLGAGSYEVGGDGSGGPVRLDPQSALGILRAPARAAATESERLTDDLRSTVVVSRSASESTVHRVAPMDVIIVRHLDGTEQGARERRFYGLFTSKAYAEPAAEIPLVRQKLQEILAAEQVLPDSHDFREIESIFETMPKTELFLLGADELRAEIRTVRSLGAGGVRVRFRPHGRGVWVTTILPRERFSADVRRWIERLLADYLGGPVVDYQLSLGEGEQARLHFYVAPIAKRAAEAEAIERRITEHIRSWDDRLRERLIAEHRGPLGRALAERYGTLFTPHYKAATDVPSAVDDIRHLEALTESAPVGIEVANAGGGDADRFTVLKLYLRGEGIVLSDFLPLLENLGLRVFAEESVVLGEGQARFVLVRFLVQDLRGRPLDARRDASALVPAILEIHAGRAENDSLNRLVVDAGFDWREVELLRTYRNLACQAGAAPSGTALNDVFLRHPGAARALADLFTARFDPAASDREAQGRAARQRFWKALESVDTASEDQMLRNYLALIEGTLRTNYFRPVRTDHPFFAIKLHSQRIEFLPKPRPLYEVYVHSARMEGLHLRGGKVARGGIRWSDRPDDFRGEILGLMKTQMVKNAVIVPVGSKGGFVVKRSKAGAEGAAEVRECYSTLMRGLLDLTDNIVHGEIVPPANVVRHDGDDPYLVVAADKGTATFSDLANSIAEEYGYWLGDAFASGGSHGYDHKREGITARGAWECVQRHFREVGKDVRREPLDVVGIGDMSGDVFGNGMLMSNAIRLKAAFNHAHVFIDPSPDPEASFRERRRLFALPRSAWTDYDRKVLSAGAMVVARDAKAAPLSPEARSLLGVEEERLDGEGLIRAILGAKTELLFNGGIGTYVRSSTETNAEVGDHANDGVRRTATEIGAGAVCEGGNLGFTQRARVELALRGGRINTDAIDNSGGVDLSDHEVNLKILFRPMLESGELSLAQRNRLLEEVKHEVIEHVLAHNSRQALLLSLDQRRSVTRLVEFRDQLSRLEQEGLLDRALEYLPDRETLRLRRGTFRGLTRPELAVITAYSKLQLQHELLGSRWIDDPTFERYLFAYFPSQIAERFPGPIRAHRLRREIIAAELGNQVIDRMGSTFTQRMARDTAADGPTAVASFVAVMAVSEADRVFDALADAPIAADDAYALCLRWEAAVESAAKLLVGVLNRSRQIDDRINAWRGALVELADRSGGGSVASGDAAVARLERLGVEPGIARSLHAVDGLRAELEIVRLAEDKGLPLADAAFLYRKAGEILDFGALDQWFATVPGDDRSEKRAAEGLREDLSAARRRMTAKIFGRTEGEISERYRAFVAEHEGQIGCLRALIEDLAGRRQISIAAMVVIVREVWKLASNR